METIAIKFVNSGHGGFKQRLHVKAFKNSNDLGAFLSKQSDNTWKGIEAGAFSYPTKSGIYAYAGSQWHNVKSLDASILAHI